MTKESEKIGLNTFVPVSLIGIVVVCIAWVFSVKAECDANTLRFHQLRNELTVKSRETSEDRKLFLAKLDNIAQRLSNIEGYLKSK